MRRNVLKFFILVLYIFCFPCFLYAISLNASPNPAFTNQNVSFTITSSFSATPSCYIEINFGDSQNWHEVGFCNMMQCVLTANHSYSNPGTYTVTARKEAQKCMSSPLPPDPVTLQLTVQCPGGILEIISNSILPAGTSGQSYSFQLQTTGGQGSVTYSLINGFLPPGLILNPSGNIAGIPNTPGDYRFTIQTTDGCQTKNKEFSLRINCTDLTITSPSQLPTGTVNEFYSYRLQSSGGQPPVIFSLYGGVLPQGLSISQDGLISGTPLTQGNYTFTINAVDSCPLGNQSAFNIFNLEIRQPSISISVTPIPSTIYIPRGQSSTRNINYQFKSTPVTNITLTSQRGDFLVNNEVIESVEKSITANISNGIGSASENLIIPIRIIEKTIRKNTTNIIYRRVFSTTNINIIANVFIHITTEAGSDFRIKRIELYFDNKRAETTIQRNYQNLKAYADIRFVGTGLLQGYWEVDGRILSYVNQHLSYGRSITLETPHIPPLPTFDTGTHIVRFVITNPETEIPLPSIIYFVTPSESIIRPLSIKLIEPLNKKTFDFSPLSFHWEKPQGIDIFVIHFYNAELKKPVFSAYVKNSTYKIPEAVLNKVFVKGEKYLWKISGFNDERNLTGDSEMFEFTFK